MKYYLGIDGGGTKTTYTVIDEKEKIIFSNRGQGTSIDTYPSKEVQKRLVTHIENLPYTFSGIYAGLGGIASDKDIENVCKMLKKAKNLKGKVGAGNDVTNALKGTIPDGNGIVIIIGTGSVAYGVNGNKSHRAGGYGYKESDPGSAYSIGLEAVKYFAKVLDKRIPESSFSRAIENAINCHNVPELITYITNMERAQVAQLAQIVTSYSNNTMAKSILNWGITELLMCVNTVFRECEFKTAKLAIVGSLGNADTYYKTQFLKRLDKNIKYVHGAHDAGLGSALLAKELDSKK